jgi:hypothetical protein
VRPGIAQEIVVLAFAVFYALLLLLCHENENKNFVTETIS